MQRLINVLQQMLTACLNWIGQFFINIFTWLLDRLNSIVQTLTSWMQWLLDALISRISSFFAWIWNTIFVPAWEIANERIFDLLNGLIDILPVLPQAIGGLSLVIDLPVIIPLFLVCFSFIVSLMVVKVILKLIPAIY